MLTDNGNFTQVKTELILLLVPLGEAQHNYCSHHTTGFCALCHGLGWQRG